MKKAFQLFTAFIFVFMVVATFSTTAYANGGQATSFILAGAEYSKTGVVLTFTVNGTVNGLGNAKFVTSEKTFNFSCKQVSETSVVCKLPKKAAGLSGTLSVGSLSDYLTTPASKDYAPLWCYDAVNYYEDEEGDEYLARAGGHCQDAAAYQGQRIYWAHDDDDFFYYVFNDEPLYQFDYSYYNGTWAFYWERPDR